MMKYLLIKLVKGYRLFFSPWVGNNCRFEPTCSQYAIQALETHGAVRGSMLTTWRVLRCNPWCQGGCDPVPESIRKDKSLNKGMFTHLLEPKSLDTHTPQSAQTTKTDKNLVKVSHD